MARVMTRVIGAAIAVGVIAWMSAAAAWVGLLHVRAERLGERFDFVAWEAQAAPGWLLYRLGAPWRGGPTPEEALARYFALADRSGSEARALENAAEAEVERRVTVVLAEQGLRWPGPGFLPPVDIEMGASPRILVTSPRARIERLAAEPLRPDLDRDAVRAIEAREEAGGQRSALVVPSGGIATFPAIVAAGDDYRGTVQAAAHEWLHHYLSLYPLGQAYFRGPEAQTLNETVADIGGDAIAALVFARFPDPPGRTSTPTPTPAASTPGPRVDVTTTLRELRVEVDALLARGEVEAAERRMDEVRASLAARGVGIRRINQAYFAWYGTYAARPESVDPLGAQLRALLQRSGGVRGFMEQVRGVQTREDVTRLVGQPPVGEPPAGHP
ncbi:MAG: hypothetical protein WC211_09500 [Dehalococcoidia bacterium]